LLEQQKKKSDNVNKHADARGPPPHKKVPTHSTVTPFSWHTTTTAPLLEVDHRDYYDRSSLRACASYVAEAGPSRQRIHGSWAPQAGWGVVVGIIMMHIRSDHLPTRSPRVSLSYHGFGAIMLPVTVGRVRVRRIQVGSLGSSSGCSPPSLSHTPSPSLLLRASVVVLSSGIPYQVFVLEVVLTSSCTFSTNFNLKLLTTVTVTGTVTDRVTN
jgi:hypothetical protein